MSSIKQKFLPPSSASFHHFEKTALQALNRIEASSRALDEKLSLIDEKLSLIDEKSSILQKQISIYSEVALKDNKEETSFDTRVRLFSLLPEATGQLRKCQKATSKLMKALDEILDKNNIEYWFGYGSLLGAYTRQSPIPWDDDIDICMHRGGLEKLKKILEDSQEYQVTKIYDWYVRCIQYRFCSKDYYLPSFIDIGVWDYATEYSEAKDERLRQLRLELMDEFNKASLPYWDERKLLFATKGKQIISATQMVEPETQDRKRSRKDISVIEGLFDKYIQKAYDEGIFCNEDESSSYAYSFDNLYMPKRQMLFDKKLIHPTVKIPYEGFEVSCPKETKDFLDTCYSSWPYIPNDSSLIRGGHIDNIIIENPLAEAAMNKFIAD